MMAMDDGRRPYRSAGTFCLLILTGSMTALGQDAGCGVFEAVPSPNEGAEANFLLGVTALAPDDVWAVGTYRVVEQQFPAVIYDNLPLTVHFDGSAWSLVTAPTPPNGGEAAVWLHDAFGLASDDVWAVGSHVPLNNTVALAMHWDGDDWDIVPNSTDIIGGSRFSAIDGVASDDLWVVGFHSPPIPVNSSDFMAAHWDGSNWEVFTLPPLGTGWNELTHVQARASDDVWALGGTGVNAASNPYLFHWDGSSWSEVTEPLDPFQYSGVFDLQVFAADDLWIQTGTEAVPFQYLFLHWDGASWTEHVSPDPFHQANFAGDDSEHLYSVGHDTVLRWTGEQWEVIDTLADAHFAGFFDAEMLPDGTIWSVGRTEAGDDAETLIGRVRTCTDTVVADLDGDGMVDVQDLLQVLAAWGPCDDPCPPACAPDLDGDCAVGTGDLLVVLAGWS